MNKRKPRAIMLATFVTIWSCSPVEETSSFDEPDNENPAQEDGARANVSSRVEVEVAPRSYKIPKGTSAPRQLRLAFRLPNGKRRQIDRSAIAYARFRDNVAVLDIQRRLVLISPSGAKRVLAKQAGAPPVQAPSGELVYAVKYQTGVEIHVLDSLGNNRTVASGLGSAGLLAPQEDGRILFIGTAKGGGVAGLWIIDSQGARCLTNCELETGSDYSERFIPLPSGTDTMKIVDDYVEWTAADGTSHSSRLDSRQLPINHFQGVK
jgi:hypothetical protein